MKRLLSHSFLFAIACLASCSTQIQDKTNKAAAPLDYVPEWSKEVVWYQIFVERFRNGDRTNDPTREDILGSYPGYYPEHWTITPWTQDWYRSDKYFDELEDTVDLSGNKIDRFEQKVQLRRYGGDLQGVLDKLDYLDSLGVTAVYFNPLNDAPSLHKYDARNWRHIDRNFGPTPKRDAAIMAGETPIDPSTWKLTGADSLFIVVIDQLHKRGIRVIMDYSWNHTGQTFWAVQDVRRKGPKSDYVNWYWVNTFDNPNTLANELDMKGWAGVSDLPEIKKTVLRENSVIAAYEGNLYDSTAKQHIFNITKRWLDPNGDGDVTDGVDGFRLDVAAEIGLEFWREYRAYVRSINPEAYLVGEVWWEQWPDRLLDPAPFLQGDVFDAVMNYRWYKAARHFFAAAPDEMKVSAFVDSLERLDKNLNKANLYAMMNVAASHDAPRVATSLYNKNKYKVDAKAQPGNHYKINKPDSDTYKTLRMLLVHQFTYVGAPHIWAGDEMGMWGADDPDTRKPLIWPDYDFEPEATHPLGEQRPVDIVKFDPSLFNFYQQLIALRKGNPVLIHGNIDYIDVDDQNKILAYSRNDEKREIIIAFNLGGTPQKTELPVRYETAYTEILSSLPIERAGSAVVVTIPARGFAVVAATGY